MWTVGLKKKFFPLLVTDKQLINLSLLDRASS